jgi:PAS domain S-box-containing protein
VGFRGCISPFTGLFSLLSSCALLLLIWKSACRIARTLIEFAGAFTCLAGLAGVTGYLFQSPLLEESGVIAFAALTAIGFLTIGAALIAALRQESRLLAPLLGDSLRAKMLRTFLPLTAGMVYVFGLGYALVEPFPSSVRVVMVPAAALLFAGLMGWATAHSAARLAELLEQAEARRQQMAATLRESEKKFRLLAENMADVVWIVEAESQHFRYISPSFSRLFGFPVEEAMRAPAFDYLTAESKQRVLTELPQRLAEFRAGNTDKFYTDELAQGHKDGYVVNVEISSRIFRNEETGQWDIHGVTRDITQRKLALEALRQTNEALETLFRSAPLGIVVMDLEAQVMQWSPAAETLFGWRAQEVIGKPLPIVPEEYWNQFWANFSAQIKTGSNFAQERPAQRKDGVMLDVAVWAAPLHNTKGEVYALMALFWDVTAKKQADAAQQKITRQRDDLLKRLQLQFERMPMAFLLMDASLQVLEWNPAAERIFGFSRAEAVGHSLFALVTPPPTQRLMETMLPKVQTGQDTVVSIYESLTRDRKTILCEWHQIPLRDEANRLVGIMAMVQDVTESQRASAQLHLQSSALSATANAIIIANQHGEIEWINPAFTRLTGYSFTECIGRNPRFLNSGLHSRDFYTAMWDTILAGKVWHGELINRRKDDDLYAEEMTITPVKNEVDRILHFVAIKQDITSRRQAEEEAEKLRRQNRLILESAGEGILGLDEDGSIIFANPAASALCGWSISELESQTIFQVLCCAPPELPLAPDKGPIHATLRDGIVHRSDQGVVWCKDGSRFPVAFISTPMRDESGTVAGAVVAFKDITERKRTEEQILSSLAEKEVLLREIHHRVKNNLEVIISLVDLMARDIAQPEVLGQFRELQESARAMAMVHESLYQAKNLARIEAAAYFAQVVGNLHQAYGTPHIRLNLAVDKEVTLGVDQAIPLGLVVTELVTNAFKYAFPPDQNQAAPEIQVGLQRENGGLVLRVADNGPGLPEALDWQKANTLGLRLVNILARQLNARLEAQHRPGTTFKLILANPPGHGMTIPA